MFASAEARGRSPLRRKRRWPISRPGPTAMARSAWSASAGAAARSTSLPWPIRISAAAVAYYGMQPKAEQVSSIKAPLMLHYAGLDERIDAGIPAFEAALKARRQDLSSSSCMMVPTTPSTTTPARATTSGRRSRLGPDHRVLQTRSLADRSPLPEGDPMFRSIVVPVDLAEVEISRAGHRQRRSPWPSSRVAASRSSMSCRSCR